MQIEELTGHEIEALEKALGEPVAKAAEEGNLMVAYALYWVERRRREPDYTFDQAKGLTMGEVSAAIGDLNEPVPKAAGGNGEASQDSAAIGA